MLGKSLVSGRKTVTHPFQKQLAKCTKFYLLFPAITCIGFSGYIFLLISDSKIIELYCITAFSVILISSLFSFKCFFRNIDSFINEMTDNQTASYIKPIDEEPDNYSDSLNELEDNNSNLEEQLTDSKTIISKLINQIYVFIDAVGKEELFSTIIQDKTEEATHKLSDHVYEIVETGNDMSGLIKKVLTDVIEGDSSLEYHSNELKKNTDVIADIVERFNKIFIDFEHDKTMMQHMVNEIEEFTHDITEMADMTHVLGINSMLEAAKVGVNGKGFAVVANEIQKVAMRSKTIAGSIKKNVIETSLSVMNSHETQSSRIKEAIGGLENTKLMQEKIAGDMALKIENIAEGTDKSQNLSSQITGKLDDITIHLQYQDMIRQVLEHMIEYLVLLKNESLADMGSCYEGYIPDLTAISDKAIAKIKNLFTTREEYEIFGIDADHSSIKNRKLDINYEIKGDVTLF